MNGLLYALIGLGAGVMGGLFGIGGGIVIVPALVYLMGFTQKQAQGTSLAVLLAPIGILGVANYYKARQMDLVAGLYIAAGFLLGAYVGSRVALDINEGLLRKAFSVFLVLVALQLWFRK